MDDAELNTLFHKAKAGELSEQELLIAMLLVQIDTLKAIRELDDSVKNVGHHLTNELSDVRQCIRDN